MNAKEKYSFIGYIISSYDDRGIISPSDRKLLQDYVEDMEINACWDKKSYTGGYYYDAKRILKSGKL